MKSTNPINFIQSLKNLVQQLRPCREAVQTSLKMCHLWEEINIPLKVERKKKIILPQVKNTLLLAAAEGTSINQAAATGAKMDGDTIRYHLNKMNLKEVRTTVNEALREQVLSLKKKGKLPKRCSLAIDSTDYVYYGKVRDPLVCHYKNSYVYRYIMLSTVGEKVSVPLTMLPVAPLDTKVKLIEELLTNIQPLKLRIIVIYLDRGFHAKTVIIYFYLKSLPFVIGAKKTTKIKALLTQLPKDNKLHRLPYTIKTADGQEMPITLNAFWQGEKKGWFTSLSWGVNAQGVRAYWRRWGIETSFRLVKAPRIKTTTQHVAVRYLYVMVAVLLVLFYAMLRLGDSPSFLCSVPAVTHLLSEEPVTLYRVRRLFRTLTEGGERA